MKLIRKPAAILSLALLTLASCGGKKESEETKSTLGALKEFTERAEELSKKEPVEPVNFQELKTIVPEKLGGIPRTEIEATGNTNFGFQLSMVTAVFSDDDKRLKLDIMDLGGVGGAAAAGLAAWTLADTERETQDGYERTIRLDGHKGFEKYNKTNEEGELKIFFNDRFLVSLEGDQMSMDDVKSAFRELNLSSLPK